jgi:hypothetical protein
MDILTLTNTDSTLTPTFWCNVSVLLIIFVIVGAVGFARVPTSQLGFPILGVILMGTKSKVRRVNTRRVVASVKNNQSFWNVINEHHVREPMSLNRLTLIVELSVTTL